MSRAQSYLNSAWTILQLYEGQEPFASFVNKYYGQNKKFGSNDRKHITHLCYSYFRLGKAAAQLPGEEGILLALFLSSTSPNDIFQDLKPGWNDKVTLTIREKCSMLAHPAGGFNVQCSMLDVFPWKAELSDGIYSEQFAYSFLVQPDLFIRIRPGNEKIVKKKIEKAGIKFTLLDNYCISFPNSTKIDQYLDINNEFVVQDYSSQQIAHFFANIKPPTSNLQLQVWDCCAGSGGKSILAYDLLKNIELTVSDIRESILINLKKRFRQAGIRNYTSSVMDLSDSPRPNPYGRGRALTFANSPFDLIIADVPCTGSGTWGRTPEYLNYFDPKEINQYNSLQKRIVGNIIPFLKTGGCLLYITCSVFKKENEDVVKFLEEKLKLKIIKMELLKGYDKKADTMFAALLSKT